jgi:hypothetical protein
MFTRRFPYLNRVGSSFLSQVCRKQSTNAQPDWSLRPKVLLPGFLRDFAAEYPTFVHLGLQWGDMDAFAHLNK